MVTNKDTIRGVVHVDLRSELTVKNIVVKLEGIARTEVPMPEDSAENQKRARKGKRTKDGKNVAFEVHKVLYRTSSVFPPKEIAQASVSSQYTLKPGTYDYPFAFVLPFKTECAYRSPGSNSSELAQSMSHLSQKFLGIERVTIGARGVDVQRPASGHVEAILPPSLSGLGEFASIKYFLKVTVNKASFFKVNTRAIEPFIFLPVDRPDLHDDNRQAFVRRELRIGIDNIEPSSNADPRPKGGFLKRLVSGRGSALAGLGAVIPGRTISFVFEARYPVNTGFTPLQDLPLKLLVIFPQDPKTLRMDNPLILDEFALVLYAATTARAQQFEKTQKLRLDLCNKVDLGLKIDLNQARLVSQPGRAAQYEIMVPPQLLADVQIPDIVSPSFSMCNISRAYSIEIVAGFRSSRTLPTEYVSLLADIQVTSGIDAPTPAPRPTTSTSVQQTPQPQPATNGTANMDSKPPPPPELAAPPSPPPPARPERPSKLASDLQLQVPRRPVGTGATAANDPSLTQPAMDKAAEAAMYAEPENGTQPPPYEEINGAIYSNVDAPPERPRGRSRRKFRQAEDYYEDMDADD